MLVEQKKKIKRVFSIISVVKYDIIYRMYDTKHRKNNNKRKNSIAIGKVYEAPEIQPRQPRQSVPKCPPRQVFSDCPSQCPATCVDQHPQCSKVSKKKKIITSSSMLITVLYIKLLDYNNCRYALSQHAFAKRVTY